MYLEPISIKQSLPLFWYLDINAWIGILSYQMLKGKSSKKPILHSIYGLQWYRDPEYPNGDYFVTVTATDV
jgi:hypothetical protein